jgi:N-acetylmuramic acid 6-phosphate (MurNAc-6-P) etherase
LRASFCSKTSARGLGSVIAMTPSLVFAADDQRLADAAQKVVTTYPQSLSDRVALQPDANGRLVDLAEGTAGGLGLRGEKDTSVPTL